MAKRIMEGRSGELSQIFKDKKGVSRRARRGRRVITKSISLDVNPEYLEIFSANSAPRLEAPTFGCEKYTCRLEWALVHYNEPLSRGRICHAPTISSFDDDRPSIPAGTIFHVHEASGSGRTRPYTVDALLMIEPLWSRFTNA